MLILLCWLSAVRHARASATKTISPFAYNETCAGTHMTLIVKRLSVTRQMITQLTFYSSVHMPISNVDLSHNIKPIMRSQKNNFIKRSK